MQTEAMRLGTGIHPFIGHATQDGADALIAKAISFGDHPRWHPLSPEGTHLAVSRLIGQAPARTTALIAVIARGA